MEKEAQDMLLSRSLIDEILNHEGGHCKKASAATSQVTRTTIREEGFFRAILPFDTITNDELDYDGYSELPGVWFEMEPDSPPARTIPFNSTPNTFQYKAEKYLVVISLISTEEATKNIDQLRTYKTDIRQIVNDNMLRDIHTEEDTTGIAYVDKLIGSPVAYGSATAESQNVTMTNAGFARKNIKRAVTFLSDRKLPTGVYLINQRTASEFLGWGREEIGGDLAEKLLQGGLKNLEKFQIMGANYLVTIKNDLVANGAMYQFTTKEFLGNALMLEDITVTIKKEYDIIRMRAQERVGRTIGNSRGLQKLNFELEGLTELV
jgi:hypothetical protein